MTTCLRGVSGLAADAAVAFAAAHYGGKLGAAGIQPADNAWTSVQQLAATAAAYPASAQLWIDYPMVPPNGTLTAGSTGSYDSNADAFVSSIVNAGIAARTVVVIGGGMNRAGLPWSASASPAAFVTYWNRIAAKCKAAGIRTCWAVEVGQADVTDATTLWPTPANVDFVGAYVFDYKPSDATITAAQRWSWLTTGAPNALGTLASFAKAQGKPLALARWGLDLQGDTLTGVNGGGGDDPTFVDSTAAFIASNYVAAFLPYQVDSGAVTTSYALLPAADATSWPSSLYRITFGSAVPSATAAKIVNNRASTTSGATGSNSPNDRVLAKLVPTAGPLLRYAWDALVVFSFGSTADVLEVYPGAADFDPAAGVGYSTGLQAQVSSGTWRLGYRNGTSFVTLASGSFASPLAANADYGLRVVTGVVDPTAGTQPFTLYQGAGATPRGQLAQVATVTLTQAQRTAAGGAGAFFVQQLGPQAAGGTAQTTTFAQIDPIPGAS